MIRVLIAATTPMLRAGLRGLLASSAVQVVGETATLTERAVDLADVDVIVVADEALLAEVARSDLDEGRLALVVLSHDEQPLEALRALPLRGWALAPLDASATELQSVVGAVAQGMIVLPLALADRLLGQRAVHSVLTEPLAEPLAEPLTAREREVLDLVSQGLSNKLIARALQISEHTVKFHVSSIYTKLGASSRTDAVSRGARYGLITL
jgi:DNA-binding NarL/FixJ family response regulator